LREFAIKGYVLDKKRMENGSFLGEDYYEHPFESDFDKIVKQLESDTKKAELNE
jgi:hypothetical protein